jgi:NAD(P)-dependent dehydrogenase (short-subunit alcohol dehydrogenase family)
VKAPFFLTAAVAPAMIAAGGGVIINLGSWIARLGIPDAIAHAAVYLASDEADFVHGAVIDVDGGRTTVAVVAA